MESLSVHLLALLSCLVLFVNGTGANSGISYHMSNASLENCVTTCGSVGLVCAKTGGFPTGDASSIFKSLGIVCENNTDPEAAVYIYDDQPCYMATGLWKGQCIGFKNIPDIIDCVTVNNTDIQRLCPCRDPEATTAPNSQSTFTKSSSVTEKPRVTTDSQEEKRYKSSESKRDLSKTVTAVITVIAVVTIICVAGIFWKWRRNRSKREQNGECTSGEKGTDVYAMSTISAHRSEENETNIYATPGASADCSLGRSKSQENLMYESMDDNGECPADEDSYGYVSPDDQVKNDEPQQNALYELMWQ